MKDEQRGFLFLLQSSLVKSSGYELYVIRPARSSHSGSDTTKQLEMSSLYSGFFLGLGKMIWTHC